MRRVHRAQTPLTPRHGAVTLVRDTRLLTPMALLSRTDAGTLHEYLRREVLMQQLTLHRRGIFSHKLRSRDSEAVASP